MAWYAVSELRNQSGCLCSTVDRASRATCGNALPTAQRNDDGALSRFGIPEKFSQQLLLCIDVQLKPNARNPNPPPIGNKSRPQTVSFCDDICRIGLFRRLAGHHRAGKRSILLFGEEEAFNEAKCYRGCGRCTRSGPRSNQGAVQINQVRTPATPTNPLASPIWNGLGPRRRLTRARRRTPLLPLQMPPCSPARQTPTPVQPGRTVLTGSAPTGMAPDTATTKRRQAAF